MTKKKRIVNSQATAILAKAEEARERQFKEWATIEDQWRVFLHIKDQGSATLLVGDDAERVRNQYLKDPTQLIHYGTKGATRYLNPHYLVAMEVYEPHVPIQKSISY